MASPISEKFQGSHSKLNSANKIFVQESTISKDRKTSPLQTVISLTKLTDPFTKFGEKSNISTADVNNVKKNNNLFDCKSPNNFNLNPNFFQKRKHSELVAPKELKFEKELKINVDQKKSYNLDSFVMKNNFK
jgi:hypothetical protein